MDFSVLQCLVQDLSSSVIYGANVKEIYFSTIICDFLI